MQFHLLALAALSAAAACATAAEPGFTRTDPVVVTATRFEERYGDKPVNLSVISAEDIRSSPAKTVPDLLAERAGIAIHDLFGNNASSTTVDMRGFGVTGTQNTLILVDGRRVSDIDLSGVQWSSIPLSAIDRIEIVRGGGSVLYGEGASAGVINIITRRPATGTRSIIVSGRVGSYDTREGTAYASIGGAAAAVSVFTSHFESSGYRANNDNRQTNAMADLRWAAPLGDVSLKIAHDNQGIRFPGARTVQPSAGVDQLATDRRGTSTPLDWGQHEGTRALIDWRGALPFGEFNLGAGWRDKTQKSNFDFAGFPDYREVDLTVKSLTPRVKVDLPLAGRQNALVVGVDWYSWDYERRVSNAAGNIATPFTNINAHEDTAGVYVLDTLTLTERLSFVAGARRERLRIHGSDRFDPTAPGGAFASAAPTAAQRAYENAWELGARYEVVPGAAVIAKTARSFRFANVDEIYEASPVFTNQFQFLEPQTSRSHEVGVDFRRGGYSARATVFQIDVDNEIHLDPFTTGVGNRNFPPIRRRGFELEATARPMSQLNLALAYSYIQAKFREGVLPGGFFTATNVNVADRTVPLVPRHKATLRAAWDFTPATKLATVISYVSDQFMDNDEPNSLGAKIPAYTLVDVKLAHRSGPWTFAAAVNNLFGEKYYNYAVRSQFVADRYNAYPLPERNGMISVEYQFR